MCSAGAINDANKIDLAPWGYAPGSSIVTCTDCTRAKSHELSLFIGHKHGYRCAEHALEARQSAIRAQEGILTPDPDQELADAALGLIKAASDRWIRRAFISSLLPKGRNKLALGRAAVIKLDAARKARNKA